MDEVPGTWLWFQLGADDSSVVFIGVEHHRLAHRLQVRVAQELFGLLLPYTANNIRRDVGGRSGRRTGRYRGEVQTVADYAKFTKLSDFSRNSPSRFIIYTEAHATLPANDLGFHDTFYTSQLPWGAFPRMSDDKRHPGGINAAFFDGSARTMGFTVIDVGWPEKQQFRLKWFTVVPPEIEP